MIINLDKEIARDLNTTSIEEVRREIAVAKSVVFFILNTLDNRPQEEFSNKLFLNLLIELRRCEHVVTVKEALCQDGESSV